MGFRCADEKINGWLSVVSCAVEAINDDLTSRDSDFCATDDIVDGRYVIRWKWRSYSNEKAFNIDDRLVDRVKGYLFDLCVMMANL